jgi:type II secretion system protein N
MNRFLQAIQLSEGARTALRRYLGYPLFFVLSFLLSAYLTFPYERVREVIERQVAVAVPGAELEIVSLEPAWLTGVEARGVSLRLPSTEEGGRPMSVTIPRVYARAGIFSYLFGTLSVSYEAELDGGGIIEGSFDDESEEDHARTRLIAHLENVDLRRIGPLRAATRLPVTGIVSGDIDVTLDDDADATTGTISLDVTDASVGDGRASLTVPGPLPIAITVARLELGTINIRADVEHGTARFTQLVANGTDAEVRGSGTIRLVRPVRNCALDLLLRVNILQAYRDRNTDMAGALSLAENNEVVRPYRAADGAYQFRLQGTPGGRVLAAPAGSASLD